MELRKVNKQDEGVVEGRIVNFVFEYQPGIITCRPAVIVNAWQSAAYEHGEVNLQVLLDFTNDELYCHVSADEAKAGRAWRTSVPYSANREPGTWHWPVESMNH